MTTTQQKLTQFLAVLDITPEDVRVIQSLVDKIRFEAYTEGRVDPCVTRENL